MRRYRASVTLRYAHRVITHTLGAVLTGGKATRMGSSKADLMHLGVRFIDHVINALSLVLADVVVCGGMYDGPRPVIPDPVADAGPLAGILAALDHSNGRPVMVVPVDMPLITSDLITRLVEPRVGSLQARIATGGDTVQPLCAAYGEGLGPLIVDRLRNHQHSVFGLLDQVEMVEHVPADPHTLTNVNTPQEYAFLTGGARA